MYKLLTLFQYFESNIPEVFLSTLQVFLGSMGPGELASNCPEINVWMGKSVVDFFGGKDKSKGNKEEDESWKENWMSIYSFKKSYVNINF